MQNVHEHLNQKSHLRKKKDVCTQLLYCIGAELNVLATILTLESCINLSLFCLYFKISWLTQSIC